YTSSATGSNTLGEDDFLTLLVAQLENQDPLEPQSDTEFIAQLAQFSSLEQQTTTNEKLDELIAAQGSSNQMSAFSLLGQKVSAPSDSFYLQGDSLELGFSLDQPAAESSMNIVNSNGDVVVSLNFGEVGAGDNFVSWDGTDSSGNQLPADLYKMEISATDSDGNVLEAQPLIKATVDEINLDTADSVLVTDAGEILLSDVSAVMTQ
ncbi:MAG: flagellar hook assembly protein FlgD, partial [Candidatus Marinimicrobia bacterium]|nr:flagellar hook assembly protein FlgD [Candidatus Neomarinimicrobiota bacterium]